MFKKGFDRADTVRDERVGPTAFAGGVSKSNVERGILRGTALAYTGILPISFGIFESGINGRQGPPPINLWKR